jgi:hypothetical protein
MRPFEVLETTDLVNVLAEYTARYTKMLTEGGKEKDIINCKETIGALITEMELRKRPGTVQDPSGKNR